LSGQLNSTVTNANFSWPGVPFIEADVVRDVGKHWLPLSGSFHGAGYSIERHDFFAKRKDLTGPRGICPEYRWVLSP
jgi:hypothetical protein